MIAQDRRAAVAALLMVLGAQSVAGGTVSFAVSGTGAPDDPGELTAVQEQGEKVSGPGQPPSLVLQQNSPNPFNPRTTIRFRLPAAAHTQLAVYNVLGCAVATLLDEERKEGYHEVSMDASDLPPGIYFYRLTAGDRSLTRRMIVLK